MKRSAYLILLFIMAATSTVMADPVYFGDVDLKAAVESELGVSDPTPSQMLWLYELTYDPIQWGHFSTDLTGLEYATNLEYLVIHYFCGDYITPLTNLTNLTVLTLGSWACSGIDDISPVSGLTNLTELTLHGQNISDISALANLTNLTKLNLSENFYISNINPLANLTELTELYIGSNPITDSNALSNLTKLTRLDIGFCELEDISAFSNLTNLTYLRLLYNNISDISPLSSMTFLETLELNENPLNTPAYCEYIPLISANNPALTTLYYDADPNPLTNDCSTDISELELFLRRWLKTDCNLSNNWCNGKEMDHINPINLKDFAIFSQLWFSGTTL